MEHRDLDTTDRGLYAVMRNRVKATLRNMRTRGPIHSMRSQGDELRWVLGRPTAEP